MSLAIHFSSGRAGRGFSFGLNQRTPFHAPGTSQEVEAHIAPGGNVILRGATYLVPERLREYARDLKRRAMRTRHSLPGSVDRWADISEASRMIDRAENLLCGSHLRYSVLYRAWRLLDEAEQRLSGVWLIAPPLGPFERAR